MHVLVLAGTRSSPKMMHHWCTLWELHLRLQQPSCKCKTCKRFVMPDAGAGADVKGEAYSDMHPGAAVHASAACG